MNFKKPTIGFSYLLALSVVAFSRYAWLPWILIYFHQRKYNSWAATVTGYGLLLTCFHIGQYLGHALTKSKSMNSSWFTMSFMTLTGSFISLCFVTRYTLVLMLFMIMGMSGMILSGVSINIDTNTPQLAILKRASELEINDTVERNLVSFAFVIIVAGYLYNSHPLAQFPVYHIAIALAIFCLLVLAYYTLISRYLQRKSLSGSSIQSGDYNPTEETVPEVEYTGPVPANFLSACGSLASARALYSKMLQWRKDKHVDDIFEIPQNHFHAILKNYPHAIHGYSLDGCAVVYEFLGKGSMAGIKAAGVSIDEVVWHFELRNELVFQRLLDPEYMRSQGATPAEFRPDTTNPDVIPQPVKRMMTVLDVSGIGVSSVTIDVIRFIGASGNIIDNYYPEQVSRLVVVNAPMGFGYVFKMISGVLPVAIRNKVDILSSVSDLDKYIHPSQRAKVYGGTGVDLGFSQGHLDFLELERKWREAVPTTSTSTGTKTAAAVARPPGAAPSATAPASVPAKPATVSSVPPKPVEAKKGFFSGWTRPTEAYLGEENTYKYNPLTGQWGDMGSNADEPQSGSLTQNGASKSNNVDAADEHVPHGTKSNTLHKNNKNVHSQLHNNNNKSNHNNNSNKPGNNHHNNQPSDSEKVRRNKALRDKVDEHGMVLAIQAAHRARDSFHSLAAAEDGSGGGLGPPSLARSRSYHESSEFRHSDTSSEPSIHRMTSHDDSDSGSGDRSTKESSFVSAKLSPQLFLIVLSIYCTCLWVQMALFTLIPVWLVVPISAGGMEYSVREVSLVLSSAAMWALLGHKATSVRTDYMLKTSPIRTLRIGCGLLVMVLFFLPCFMEYTLAKSDPFVLPDLDGSSLSVEDMEDMHAQDHRVSFITVFGRSLPSQMPISYSTFVSADRHNVAYDYVHWASSKYTFPTRSILALQLPALLFALMLCALQICRRGSGIILQLTLGNTFHDPASVRRALNGLIEIGGPTLAACLFSLGYGMGLQYPLDASSFFSIAGCQMLLVYISSILLKVQFRGDYGVMPDYEGASGSTGLSGRSQYASEDPHEILLGRESPSSQPYLRNSSRRPVISPYGDTPAPAGPSRWSEIAQMFGVVISDASLLYSPIFSAYGSKLYNLKDDFKDV